MIDPDTFVGAVALVVGLLMLSMAVFQWPRYARLDASRFKSSLDHRKTRLVVGAIGILLVGLGIVIVNGFSLYRNPVDSSSSHLPRCGDRCKSTRAFSRSLRS